MVSSGAVNESPFNFVRSKRDVERLVDASQETVVAVHAISQDGLENKLEQLGPVTKNWSSAMNFKAKSGEVLLIPGSSGAVETVLLGLESAEDLWGYAALASKLPAGTYQLADDASTTACAAEKAAVGFLLGCYTFDRYKKKSEVDTASVDQKSKLIWPSNADKTAVTAMASAFYLARDMITTPAEDLGPQHIVAEALAVAAHHGASATVIQGDELLEKNYPAIHMVGRASYRPPVLIDVRWAPPDLTDSAALPLLTLVGKGVCFDTGGLDLKPAASMKLMKKDMGGAALVLSLAHVVMSNKLPVRLRLLIPSVENSVSGNAYRPLDVLQTRAGITVENGNTDAEGRLILCDALFEASTENPDMLIDAATLTGAARMALGPEVPAVFCSDDGVWQQLSQAADTEEDPLWRLPLHKGYRKMIDSKVADISSTGSQPGAGAIIAALYLAEFVKDVPRWIHVDTGGYNNSSTPGRPEGGEALALRALWRFLQDRYAK